MEKLMRDIDQFINPEKDDQVQEAAFNRFISRLEMTSEAFQELIDKMGPYLTNEDTKLRARGALLVARALRAGGARPLAAALAPAAAAAAAAFFRGRLGDHPSAPAAQAALGALVDHRAGAVLANDGALLLCEALLTAQPLQALAQPLRSGALDLVRAVLRHRPPAAAEAAAPGGGVPPPPPPATAADERLAGWLCEALQGEKDPRCLLAGLECLRIALAARPNLDSEVAEKVFDTTACYFPVAFTPPPNNPQGITKEMLVLALDAVLCGHPALQPHLLPFLMDKMTDGSKEDQIESIKLFAQCTQLWGFGEQGEHCRHLEQLAGVLTDEATTPGAEDDLVEACMRGATQIGAAVVGHEAGARGGAGGAWARFGSALTARALGALRSGGAAAAAPATGGGSAPAAPAAAARRAAGLLAALAAAGGLACRKVAGAVVPAMLDQHGSGTREADRSVALAALAGLAAAIDPQSDFSLTENGAPLQPFAESLYNAFIIAVESNDEERRDGICGLQSLITKPPTPLVSIEKVANAVQKLTDMVLDTRNQRITRGMKIEGLQALCKISLKSQCKEYCDIVIQVSVTGFIRRIHSLLDEKNCEVIQNHISVPLLALTELSTQPKILRMVIPDLLFIIINKDPKRASLGLRKKRFQVPILEAISQILAFFATKRKGEDNGKDNTSIEWILEEGAQVTTPPLGLSKSRRSSSLQSPGGSKRSSANSLLSPRAADCLNVGLNDLISAVTDEAENCTSAQPPHLNEIIRPTAQVVKQAMQGVGEGSQSIFARQAVGKLMRAPSVDGKAPHPVIFTLLEAIINSLALDSQVFHDEDLVGEVVAWHLSYLRAGAGGAAACRALGALANKLPADGAAGGAALAHLLGKTVQGEMLEVVEKAYPDCQTLPGWEDPQLFIQCFVWILKGVVMRGDLLQVQDCAVKVLCKLASSQSGLECHAAEGFGLIMEDNKASPLSVTYHRESPLWKQRFYSQSCPALLAELSPGEEEGKTRPSAAAAPLLAAVAGLAAGLPAAALRGGGAGAACAPAVARALAEGAAGGGDAAAAAGAGPLLQAAAVRALKKLLQPSIESVAPHLSSIVTSILKLLGASPAYTVKAQTRYECLQCLNLLAELPGERVRPFKTQVIKQLQKTSLDDPRRPVRQMAVYVCNKWAVVGVVV